MRLLDRAPHGSFLIFLCVIAQFSGYRNWLIDLSVDKVSMTTFTAPVFKTSEFQFGN